MRSTRPTDTEGRGGLNLTLAGGHTAQMGEGVYIMGWCHDSVERGKLEFGWSWVRLMLGTRVVLGAAGSGGGVDLSARSWAGGGDDSLWGGGRGNNVRTP